MKKLTKRVVAQANTKLKRLGQQLGINLTLPIAELLMKVAWQVEVLAGAAGLEIMRVAMNEEVRKVAGERYRHGADVHRWGRQPGYVMFGGQKVPTERPRVRQGKAEIPLSTYAAFQQDVRLDEAVMDQMMLGISTRNYEPSIRAVCEGYGVKKSSVSRRFIAASKEALDGLLQRPIGSLDLCVIFIDGIERGGQCLIVAVGVDCGGRKHALGLWQGATENATVCKALLTDLIGRGMDPDKTYLFIIDGSKALASAICRTFSRFEIQRCQIHKRRNVTDHLPESHQATIERRMTAAYKMTDYKDAKAELQDLVHDLEKVNPSAARSLSEGLEETLTLHRLGVPELLRISLSTTNIIESCLSRMEHVTGRVKRWQGGDHVQRWMATALLEAEKKFRTVKGYRSIKDLMDKMNTSIAQKIA